jgi:hypothetical protein
MLFHVGSYVIHRKLTELGSGEIVKAEMGSFIIRFASGERRFSEALVGAHLEKTTVAPVYPVATRRKPAAPKKKPVAEKPAVVS